MRSLRKHRNILRSFQNNFRPHLYCHPCICIMWGFVHSLMFIESFSYICHAYSCLQIVYNIYSVCVFCIYQVSLICFYSSFLRYKMSNWMFGLCFSENETINIFLCTCISLMKTCNINIVNVHTGSFQDQLFMLLSNLFWLFFLLAPKIWSIFIQKLLLLTAKARA